MCRRAWYKDSASKCVTFCGPFQPYDSSHAQLWDWSWMLTLTSQGGKTLYIDIDYQISQSLNIAHKFGTCSIKVTHTVWQQDIQEQLKSKWTLHKTDKTLQTHPKQGMRSSFLASVYLKELAAQICLLFTTERRSPCAPFMKIFAW